jgi:exopolysaccharide biosynthesis protein
MSLTAEQERFRPDITQGRAPRTAFGIGRQGEWLLLVADGRQRHSKGLTLTELAQLLKEKGAWEALNFDGGGSSAMVIGSQVVNQPSDGQERPVASALLLLKR